MRIRELAGRMMAAKDVSQANDSKVAWLTFGVRPRSAA